MKLLKFFRTVRAIGTTLLIAGDLLVKAGSLLLGSNLEPRGSELPDDNSRHNQDPPTQRVENEKPEEESQREFDFGDDSFESSSER